MHPNSKSFAAIPLAAAKHALDPARGRRETAQYIADMALEMRNLAKGHGLKALQGLLEVAYYEAFTVATQAELPEGELERLQRMSRASAG
ncbi:MAG: hypothetical protein KGO53_10625 [Alphaproteobacteria bacterium]|nr:hypothetical protein [Alphaproteobacteria bacterium]